MSSGVEITPTSVPKTREDFLADVAVVAAFSERIHLDVVDGTFAAGYTWPYYERGMLSEVNLAGIERLQVTAHLMAQEPRTLGDTLVSAGVRRVIAHMEAFTDVSSAHAALSSWKMRGVETGLAILLDTPLQAFVPFAEMCDFVHVMTIATIGVQGLPFEPRGIDKVRAMRANFPKLMISVDGGVSEENVGELVKAGARRFSVGTSIMKMQDPSIAYRVVKFAAESALQ